MNETHDWHPARKRRLPITIVITLCACALATGCKVGPEFKTPETSEPPTWSGMGAAASDRPVTSTPIAGPADVAAWWTTFNDPELTSLLTRATAGNLTLAQAEVAIRQARAARMVAGSGLYPSINASASAQRSRSPSLAGSSGQPGARTSNLFLAGFDATWEIDLFGGIQRGVEAANAQVEAAKYGRDVVMVTLAGEVATTYFTLRGAQQQLAIARENLAAQQHTLKLTQERQDAGFVSALDVATAKANATLTESQIPAFDAQIRGSIFALSVLLGQDPGALMDELAPKAPLPTMPQTVPVGLPSELLQRRPDIRQAEAQLHAATAQVGVAVADQFPKFSLTGSFGSQSNRVESLTTIANRFWSIGPAVTVPLFTGGQVKGNIEQAKAVAESATLTYRAAVLTALQDVETALVNFTTEQQRREALTDSVAADKQAVDLALQLYSAGTTDFLNVLTAQMQLYSTQTQLLQSETTIGTNLIALYKALGGGWNSSEDEQPAH